VTNKQKWLCLPHHQPTVATAASNLAGPQTATTKVTIRSGFCETVQIFSDVCWKKQFSRDAQLSGFWLGVLDLFISAEVCLHIGGQKLAQILSVYMKKLLAAQALPRTPLVDLTTLT